MHQFELMWDRKGHVWGPGHEAVLQMMKERHFSVSIIPPLNHFSSINFAAMDMKAVKDEIAEEEDDDVPGKCLFNLMRDSSPCFFFIIIFKAQKVKH